MSGCRAHESERVIVCSGDVREAGPASDHSLLTRRNSMVSASTRATMSPRSSGPYPLRFGTTTLWNSTTQVGDGMAVGRPRLACAVSAAIVSVTVWTLLGSRIPPCAEAASTAAPSSPLPAGLVTGVRCQWMRLRLLAAFALTPDVQLRVPGSAAVLADLAWSRPTTTTRSAATASAARTGTIQRLVAAGTLKAMSTVLRHMSFATTCVTEPTHPHRPLSRPHADADEWSTGTPVRRAAS